MKWIQEKPRRLDGRLERKYSTANETSNFKLEGVTGMEWIFWHLFIPYPMSTTFKPRRAR